MWAPVVEVLPGAGLVRHRHEARLHRRRPARRDDARQRLPLVGRVFYPFYAHPASAGAISPLADQGSPAAVMMLEGSLVTLGALAWLFLRLAAEGELSRS